MMTSQDPGAEDLVPSMRSVHLSDEDKQLMSAFKEKVDETGQFEGEGKKLYRGRHIPSRLFHALESSVSGGPPPASSRIGGPGQARTVVVNMQTGDSTGQQVPASQQEAPEPKKYTGGNIPSRSFRVLQQMTADDQGSTVAPPTIHQSGQTPRRSPSHYANTSGFHGNTSKPSTSPSQTTFTLNVEPTCERIERESAAAASRRSSGTSPSHGGGFEKNAGKEAVLGELRSVSGGHSPRPARPSAVPSRSFRMLQQEYGSEDVTPPVHDRGQGERYSVGGTISCAGHGGVETGRVAPNPDHSSVSEKLAATSKTYRMLQEDPSSVPSVFGKNKR